MAPPSEDRKETEDREQELADRASIPGMPRLGSVTDPTDNERERSVAEKSTAAFDPDRLGIGSSPIPRDFSSSRLFVPQNALNDATKPAMDPVQRHMFRLAAQVVSSGDVCCIKGVRQAVTIGTKIVTGGGGEFGPVSSYVMEMEVVSPFWTFCDANVSWHLRVIRATPNSQGQYNVNGAPVYALSNDLTGTAPALLYQSIDITSGGNVYIPPPLIGDGIGDLGTFYSLMYPWSQQGARESLDYVVYGPCIIMLLASVKQSDPSTRTVYVPPDSGFCGPMEEQFIQSFPNAVYRHISGSIVCEMGATQRRPGIRPYVGKMPH